MNSETVLDMSFVPCIKNDKKLINNISCKIFKCLVVNRTLQTLISKVSSL